MDFETLPKQDGKVKLKSRGYSLVDVMHTLRDLDTNYVKYVRQSQLEAMTVKGEFDKVSPFILVPVYITEDDKKKGEFIHMAFANHGLIPYCEYEVLDSYKLDDTKFFWNYKIAPDQPKSFKYGETFVFSNDEDALDSWEASMNFDEIFDHFVLEGGNDYACFAGFYFVLDEED
jgi:hypothetical protein